MTEAEWRACADPDPMLEFLRDKAGDRKLRLVACATIRCAPFHPDGRTVWDLLPGYRWFRPCQPGSRWFDFDAHNAIILTERDADGQATSDEREAAGVIGSGVLYCAEADTPLYTDYPTPGCWPAYAAAKLVQDVCSESPSRLRDWLLSFRQVFRGMSPADLHPGHGTAVCDIFRDVFGNPFRPVTLDPAWRTPTVVALAGQMYESRDFAAMPILADALQDAGCENPDVLDHCRDPGVSGGDSPPASQRHVRGCWVIDLVLGKG